MKRTLLHPLLLWPLACWALVRLLVIPWMEASLFDPSRMPGWDSFVVTSQLFGALTGLLLAVVGLRLRAGRARLRELLLERHLLLNLLDQGIAGNISGSCRLLRRTGDGAGSVARMLSAALRTIRFASGLPRPGSGCIVLCLRPCELAGVVNDCVEALRETIRSTGVELSVHVDTLPTLAEAEPVALGGVVLAGLVEHAIVQSRPGDTVSIRLVGGREGTLSLEVAFHGEHRLARKALSRPDGDGVAPEAGVFLARRFARLMGSDVSVRASQGSEGRGMVTFALPLARAGVPAGRGQTPAPGMEGEPGALGAAM